jgi:hypothetical protein
MISRVEQVQREGDSQAVHVWGAQSEDCALACELGGAPVFRLDSGGFCAAWRPPVQGQISSGSYRVSHQVLPWEEVEWRELGRALFKDLVVDREEDEYSRDPSWGTDEVEDGFLEGLKTSRAECVARLKLAESDEVLVMCAWRVFDRQRGILNARFGLGELDSESEVTLVLDALALPPERRARLQGLHTASVAWW